MRDDQVFKIQQDLSGNIATIYKQLLFLDSRMQSYEMVLSDRKSMLKAIWSPKWLKGAVDKFQMNLLQKHGKQMDEAVKKRDEESRKPKITLLKAVSVAVLSLGLFSGCVSMKVYKADIKKSYEHGYKDADAECIKLQERIKPYVIGLQERLRKFNQLNEDGSLRTKKVDDSKGWDDKETGGTWKEENK